MILSNGCAREDRLGMSDIAEQFAEFLLVKLAGRKQDRHARQETEVDTPRKRRAPQCTQQCSRTCRPVCTRNCWWDCDTDDNEYCDYMWETDYDLWERECP